jgi:hypothetical protein
MDGRRIGRHEGVQLAETVAHGPVTKFGRELASVGINIVDVANVAVVKFLFVIVPDLQVHAPKQ